MSLRRTKAVSRRSMLKRAAALSAFGPLFQATKGELSAQARQDGPNRRSAPSALKITDIRGCTVASNYDYPIIRIDTNQGVYGLGEVFCNDMVSQSLLLKPFLVGRDPLEIDSLLTTLRRFTTQGSSSGGFSAIDIALHDIAGKVYGVPVWRLLGSKLRDRLILYCDTTGVSDPKVYGARLLRRMKEDGYRFFKMDLYSTLVADKPNALDDRGICTPTGLKYLCDIIGGVRDACGWQVPIAADHFGALTVNDAIRYARAFEPYNLAWAEDMVSSLNWQGQKEIKESTTTPILCGESVFGLSEGYKALIDNQAVDLIHPDVTNSGGILEVKRICDHAAQAGIRAAIHNANSPVGQIASAHLCATITNFYVLEMHAVDIPWWQDMVTGVSKPIADKGYQSVPDSPGLGVELNESVVKAHLSKLNYAVPDGYFEPTPMYDKPLIGGHPRGAYPHLDAEGRLVDDLDEHTGTYNPPVQPQRK
jgi:L-alanine-DL-glutamate epimerase-like enolase superfamily enzyme